MSPDVNRMAHHVQNPEQLQQMMIRWPINLKLQISTKNFLNSHLMTGAMEKYRYQTPYHVSNE